jgi:hypothetical protein
MHCLLWVPTEAAMDNMFSFSRGRAGSRSSAHHYQAPWNVSGPLECIRPPGMYQAPWNVSGTLECRAGYVTTGLQCHAMLVHRSWEAWWPAGGN